MDQKALIDEILSRVAAKLAEAEEAPGARLLILTQQHGEPCHEGLEGETLRQSFRADCALLRDYQVNVEDYDVVVLYNLTVDALGKLAAGVCDTPYTKLAAQAILMGKRIYVPTEEVELFRYASTAPAVYYGMMKEKLDLLARSGLVICARSNLERAILSGSEGPGACSKLSDRPCEKGSGKEMRLTKRVLTERDVDAAARGSFSAIRMPAKAIVTALAVDYAKARGIMLVRE